MELLAASAAYSPCSRSPRVVEAAHTALPHVTRNLSRPAMVQAASFDPISTCQESPSMGRDDAAFAFVRQRRRPRSLGEHPRGEPLRLGYPLNLYGDGVHRSIKALQS